MIGAIVRAAGAEPELAAFPGPAAANGQAVVRVLAAGLNPVDRLRRDEPPFPRVLVLGASGAVGRIAVQAAKLLGASRVVAAARTLEAIEPLRRRGADELVELRGDLRAVLREASDGGFDVVIDPLFGEPLAAALGATAAGARIVNLGASAGEVATIARAALMGRTLLTHGNRSTPLALKREAYLRMLAHVRAGELTVDFEETPLLRFAEAWRRQARYPHRKLVLVPEQEERT